MPPSPANQSASATQSSTASSSAPSGGATRTPSANKKRKKKIFWLLKLPKNVAKEWWDDDKFPKSSVLGHVAMETGKIGKRKKVAVDEMPPMTLHVKTTSPIDPSIHIGCVNELKLHKRKDLKRSTFSFGKTIQQEKQNLLVYSDKPMFPKGLEVEAINLTQKKWVKGQVTSVNDNRTYNVSFEDGVMQNNMDQKKLYCPNLDPKVDKCKLEGVLGFWFNCQPVMNQRYTSLLKQRKSNSEKKRDVKIRKSVNIFTSADRESKVNVLAAQRKKTLKGLKKTAKAKKKNVRKKDEVYEQLICQAFDRDEYLTKKRLEALTGEPYYFLRPVLNRIGEYQQGGPHNGTYTLKSEYKL